MTPDRDMLNMLHLRDVEGWNYRKIAARYGKSRKAVIGLLWRVDRDTSASDPDGNQNGTMPIRWWSKT